jgi:hypothetical protein
MLQLHLVFFASLATAAVALAWFGHVVAVREALPRFACVSAASWLLAAVLLFVGMWIFTPKEPALYFPTSAAAQAVPVLVIAVALARVRKRWSREGKVLLALSLSAGFTLFAVIFMLVATCLVQSNCL